MSAERSCLVEVGEGDLPTTWTHEAINTFLDPRGSMEIAASKFSVAKRMRRGGNMLHTPRKAMDNFSHRILLTSRAASALVSCMYWCLKPSKYVCLSVVLSVSEWDCLAPLDIPLASLARSILPNWLLVYRALQLCLRGKTRELLAFCLAMRLICLLA